MLYRLPESERVCSGICNVGDIEAGRKGAKYNLNHIYEIAKVFKCSPRDFLPEKTL